MSKKKTKASPPEPRLATLPDVMAAAAKLKHNEWSTLLRHVAGMLREYGYYPELILKGPEPEEKTGGIGEDEFGVRRYMSAEELRERGLPG